MDDEELKSQIEELRARRGNRASEIPAGARPNWRETEYKAKPERRPRPEGWDEIPLEEPEGKKPKRDDGIWGVMTFQAILAVIVAISYVLTMTLSSATARAAVDVVKDKSANDFSFREQVYETVGNIVTYLNQIHPIEPGAGTAPSSDAGSLPDNSSDTASANGITWDSSEASAPEGSSSESASNTDSEDENGMGGVFTPSDGVTMPENATFAPIVFTGSLTFPIKGGGRITSGFGFRESPIYGKTEFHSGVDIAAPKGTNVLACFDGTVAEAGVNKYLGNYIILDHGKGFYTTYGHCDRLVAKEGMKIREGEVIAKVGSTGDSTGNHLHFAMKMDGLYFYPGYLFPGYIDDTV